MTRPAHLEDLNEAAKILTQDVKEYQQALIAARSSGATWQELGEAMGVNWQTARKRHDSALNGGELHLKLPTLRGKGQ